MLKIPAIEMELKVVEITCPFCQSDRVEPKTEYDILCRSVWECCRCGQEFEIDYSGG